MSIKDDELHDYHESLSQSPLGPQGHLVVAL